MDYEVIIFNKFSSRAKKIVQKQAGEGRNGENKGGGLLFLASLSLPAFFGRLAASGGSVVKFWSAGEWNLFITL